MSTVKISELPVIYALNEDTDQTLIAGVDVQTGITGKIKVTTIAKGLYSHNILNVGNNAVVLPNVVAQFVASGNSYIQTNLTNTDDGGTADIVITANTGTDLTYFIDVGYANKDYQPGQEYNNIGTSVNPLDGYLYIQGIDSSSPGGNLVVGAVTSGREIRFIAGGGTSENVVAKMSASAVTLKQPLVYVDGSTQNTSSAPFAFSNASFLKANSGFTAANSGYVQANSAFIKANAAYEAANSAGTYANTAAGTAATATIAAGVADVKAVNAGSYANSAFLKANNALANTTGTLAGALTVTGNVIVGETIVFKDHTEMRYNPSASPATFLISSANTISVKSGNKVFSFDPDGGFGVPHDLSVTGNTTIAGDLTLTNGTLSSSGNMTVNGTMVLANSNFSPTESAITIKATANVALPVNDGYMIHISGKNGVPSRIVSDSYGTNAYSVFASRTARGNVDYPAAVQTGDIIGRFSSNGYGTTKFQQYGTGRIDFVATENYTDAQTGSQIKFWNCPVGSNTLTNILSLNGDSAVFTGVVNPQKGFKYTPNVLSGIVTSLSIDIANNSLYYFKTNNTTTISLSGYTQGKIVEVWITNTDTGVGSNHTITHGCLANNSTIGATSFTLTSLHSAYIKYFSINGDQANTYCHISYS
jgi:hypothetical protein